MSGKIGKFTIGMAGAVACVGLLSAGVVGAATVTTPYGVATLDATYTDVGAGAGSVTNVVDTYWGFNSTNVYGEIQLVSGSPVFSGANVYVYSAEESTYIGSTPSVGGLVAGDPGVYGDGNDVIINGTNGNWGFSLSSSPWEGATQSFSSSTVQYSYSDTSGTPTVQFSINRSLLGDYNGFVYGGQLFDYTFHTPGVFASVTPIPASGLLAGVGALTLIGGLALRRRMSMKL